MWGPSFTTLWPAEECCRLPMLCAGATKSVRIDQWKVATIHEFLQGKLDLSKSKKKAQTATS